MKTSSIIWIIIGSIFLLAGIAEYVDTEWYQNLYSNEVTYFFGSLDKISWGYGIFTSLLLIANGLIVIAVTCMNIRPEKKTQSRWRNDDDEQEVVRSNEPKVLKMGENEYYDIVSSEFDSTVARIHVSNFVPYGLENNKTVEVQYGAGCEFATKDDAIVGSANQSIKKALQVCVNHGALYVLVSPTNDDDERDGFVTVTCYFQLLVKRN